MYKIYTTVSGRQTTGAMSVEQLFMPTTIIVALTLFLFHGEYGHCATTVPQMNNTEDMRSLLQFRKEITSDPKGFFSSWNSSVDYCNWEGIKCSRRHPGCVTQLNICNQSLGGQIPTSLGNLTFLRKIYLSENAFFGQLPDLNRLSRLQHLILNYNQLQVFAPDALRNCSNLHSLHLSANNFTGPIPHDIGFLSSLKLLSLEGNKFTRISSSFYNISTLLLLELSYNQLEGSIPEELGRFSNLIYLGLRGNKLSGSIPPTIFNHSLLETLNADSNFLHMALPSTFGNSLPRIDSFDLSDNMFYGQIPASLGNASKLSFIVLSSNSFSGHIPSSLGKLSSLVGLQLDQNKLEANDGEGWEFLDAFGNCSSIFQILSLSENQLQGSIPNSIAKLPKNFAIIALDRNNLSGIVPDSIGNLTHLGTLHLGENNLAGPIGPWVGKLRNLINLNLSYNNFNGPIPASSFGSFTWLKKLDLHSNKFEGPLC